MTVWIWARSYTLASSLQPVCANPEKRLHKLAPIQVFLLPWVS